MIQSSQQQLQQYPYSSVRKIYLEYCQENQISPNVEIIKVLDNKTTSCKIKKSDQQDISLDENDLFAISLVISHNLTNLIELEISNHRFTTDSLSIITSGLRDNVYLQKLLLPNNMIEDQGAISIALWLQNNQTIKHMDLSYNKIRDLGADALAKSLYENKSLNVLQLSRNFIEKDYFGDALKINNTLLTLELAYNNYNLESIENILKGLYDNKALQKLRMSGMSIGQIHVHLFCEVLEKNTSLMEIDWDLNLMSDDQELFEKIEQSLLINTSLISLNSNKMMITMQNQMTHKIFQMIHANEWIMNNYQLLLKNQNPQCPEIIRDIVIKKLEIIQGMLANDFSSQEATNYRTQQTEHINMLFNPTASTIHEIKSYPTFQTLQTEGPLETQSEYVSVQKVIRKANLNNNEVYQSYPCNKPNNNWARSINNNILQSSDKIIQEQPAKEDAGRFDQRQGSDYNPTQISTSSEEIEEKIFQRIKQLIDVELDKNFKQINNTFDLHQALINRIEEKNQLFELQINQQVQTVTQRIDSIEQYIQQKDECYSSRSNAQARIEVLETNLGEMSKEIESLQSKNIINKQNDQLEKEIGSLKGSITQLNQHIEHIVEKEVNEKQSSNQANANGLEIYVKENFQQIFEKLQQMNVNINQMLQKNMSQHQQVQTISQQIDLQEKQQTQQLFSQSCTNSSRDTTYVDKYIKKKINKLFLEKSDNFEKNINKYGSLKTHMKEITSKLSKLEEQVINNSYLSFRDFTKIKESQLEKENRDQNIKSKSEKKQKIEPAQIIKQLIQPQQLNIVEDKEYQQLSFADKENIMIQMTPTLKKEKSNDTPLKINDLNQRSFSNNNQQENNLHQQKKSNYGKHEQDSAKRLQKVREQVSDKIQKYKACKQELKESKRQYNLSGYWMKKVNEDAPTTRNTFGYSSYMTPNKNQPGSAKSQVNPSFELKNELKKRGVKII